MQTAPVPDRMADMPPGAELAAALAGLDLPRLPNHQIVDVLQAQARQLAHDQARLLATMVEVSRTVPGTPGPLRTDERYAWAAGELAAALTLTTRSAERELDFAETLVTDLPQVLDALSAGRLDRAKAWVFAEHLRPSVCGLGPEQVAAICAHLVPPASGWTTGQLAARLLRAIIAVDPDHARRRYQKALREREVISYLDDSGTVTITATGLPTDEAAAAYERLEQLAATIKRAGHPGRLAHIQADVFLGLLNGRYHHCTIEQITTDLLGHTAPSTTDPAPETAPAPQPAPDAAAPSPNHPPTAADRPAGEQGPTADVRTGVEIRVGLSTLLHLDDHPGEIPGLGPVIAPVARDLVTAQHRGAQWRFAITDPEGYLLLAGTTRRRPRQPRPGRCQGGIVEIHVPATLLSRLAQDAAACGDWAAVIADLAAHYARRDELTAALDRHPTSRYVRGALARHIQVRDRTCTHPGCRCPARKADLDHTHDHARGGTTTTTNTGPGCGRHHLYKTELGWQLHQPRPGHFHWTSPLGRTYRTRGEPITPHLPEPTPAPTPPEPAAITPVDDEPRIRRRPPPDSTPHGPPDHPSDSDPPPF
jgi:hypothetical protein